MQTFVCLYHHSCCIRKLKYQTARTIIKIPDSTTVHPDGEGYTSESFSARLVLSTCQESTIDTDGYWSLSPTGSDHLVVAPSLRVLPKSVAGHWKWRGHMSRWWRLMPPTQRISSNSGYHGWFFFIRILGVWNVSWSILFYSYILQIHFRTHIFESFEMSKAGHGTFLWCQCSQPIWPVNSRAVERCWTDLAIDFLFGSDESSQLFVFLQNWYSLLKNIANSYPIITPFCWLLYTSYIIL